MIKRILIGVEDSKYAEAATEYGFSLAESLGAHVGVVNIIEPVPVSINSNAGGEILGTPLQGIDSINELELLNVQSVVSGHITEHATKQFGGKVEVTQFNEYGATGEGIIACSVEFKADLIVVGTHHRSGLDRLFSSNVAEYVVRHSEVPVLVVPTKK
jgi:nucleotide-binding universal stress UspA family protein